jgi:hypothetical protein
VHLVSALKNDKVSEDAPAQVAAIMSGQMKEVAKMLIPDSEAYILAWTEHGEVYINAINNNLPLTEPALTERAARHEDARHETVNSGAGFH